MLAGCPLTRKVARTCLDPECAKDDSSGMRAPARRLVLAVTACTLALAGSAVAKPGGPPTTTGTYESDLSADPTTSNGEPSLAVNPRNERNVVATYLTNNFFNAQAITYQQTPTGPVAGLQGCNVAVSFDSGRTWSKRVLPVNSAQADPLMPNCSDSLVAFDSTGKLYAVAAVFNTVFGYGEHRVMSSTDGGRTWSKPVTIAPNTASAGQTPAPTSPGHFYNDREWISIDQSTGEVYVSGTQGWLDADGNKGIVVWMTSSRDGGRTFSPAVVTGANGSSPMAAGHGLVALATTTPNGGTPASECTCEEILVSHDHGRTFQRYGTRIADPGRAQMAANPTAAGHLALMLPDAAGTSLRVYRSTDAARRWTGPTLLGTAGSKILKPWLAYGPTGVVAVGWRAQRSDSTYDFWAAVSRDEGKTFSKPVRISRDVSPPQDWYLSVGGDDASAVTLTGDRLYASWGDWRGGKGEDVWLGGFRFSG